MILESRQCATGFPIDNHRFGVREQVDPGSAAAELATWATRILGFGAVGHILRRTRTRRSLLIGPLETILKSMRGRRIYAEFETVRLGELKEIPSTAEDDDRRCANLAPALLSNDRPQP